ncbi:MAG: 7-carboxy-7-deazaguanine synthase QueE [Flavobacteriales bacterium]
METFYTVQGEGAYAGHPAFFIRLAGCDVGCVWCDVKESWNAEDHPVIVVDDLVQQVLDTNAPLVVVTGGEPTMYDLSYLTAKLKENGLRTHIETSGTNELTGEWDWVTFSPKKFKAPVESIYGQAHELKVIVFNKTDLEWGQQHAQRCSPHSKKYLQAEWDRRDEIYPLILQYITSNPEWSISIQTHKYLGVL